MLLLDMHASIAALQSAVEAARLGSDQSGNHTSEVNTHLLGLSRQVEALLDSHKANAGSQDPSEQASMRARIPSGVTTEKSQLVYCSAAMREVVSRATRAAASEVTVLITGETGVGKELIARLIHVQSPRHGGLLVPLNCASLPKELFESVLFGHKRGSFTGAAQDQGGVIRAAEGGTLFLDEIGELPLEVQPKLLRFLQEGEIHPIGRASPIRIDTRIIASTNRRLETDVAAGRFRADMFYRLNVIAINVPSLRQRREDIPSLCDHFIRKYAASRGILLSPEARTSLMEYDWPGNVRELSNIVLRLCALAERGQTLSGADLRRELYASEEAHRAPPRRETDITHQPGSFIPPGLKLAQAVAMVKRQQVRDALTQHGGNFAKAAQQLGLSTFGLRKMHVRLWTQAKADNSG